MTNKSMKPRFINRTALSLALFLTVLPGIALAQNDAYVPSAENLKSRQEFSDARFGVFLHWGIYSMLASGEWALNDNNLLFEDYKQLAGGFFPSQFDAREWVRQIKASGAGYICLTSRHHDGFSMWDTDRSDFDIMDATPFRRDIIAELAQACREEGIRLHLYYSHLDWGRPDYPLGRTGRRTGRPTGQENYDQYLAFMKGQLEELLTKYGPIGAIWFDGIWDHDIDRTPFDWRLREQYDLIHRLQPGCLVANNHHKAPYEGEDIQIFERDLPGENTAGYSAGQQVSNKLPLETCQTMNGMWGYKITDRNYKSPAQLIQLLVRTAGKGANLLLNIGPQPNGELPAAAVTRLQQIGEWMKIYGPTVKGTQGGPVAPHAWGVTTSRDDKVYVHILNLEDTTLFLPLEKKIAKAVFFKDGSAVKFTKVPGGITLSLGELPAEPDTVIELTIK